MIELDDVLFTLLLCWRSFLCNRPVIFPGITYSNGRTEAKMQLQSFAMYMPYVTVRNNILPAEASEVSQNRHCFSSSIYSTSVNT